MKIDKSKLRTGIWYEDENGNVIETETDEYVDRKNYPEIVIRNVCFPLQVTTRTSFYYTNKDTCKHPLKFRRRTGGWVKGIKGCECKACGKTKVGKSFIPFAFMPWDDGPDTYDGFETHVTLGKFSQKCAVGMVNSGEYTLEEAIVILVNACERCTNVLDYKYGEDGYPEYSEQWKKANTVCEFCKDEK